MVTLLTLLVFAYPAILPFIVIGRLLYDVTDPPYVDMEYVAVRWLLAAFYILALGIAVGVLYFGYQASSPEKIVAVILGSVLALLAVQDAAWQLFIVNRKCDVLDRRWAVVAFVIYLAAFVAYAYLFFDRVGAFIQIFSS